MRIESADIRCVNCEKLTDRPKGAHWRDGRFRYSCESCVILAVKAFTNAPLFPGYRGQNV